MHSLFRRLFTRPATADDVQSIFQSYNRKVLELEDLVRELNEKHERLDLAFNSFRGRVYAWRKWEPADKPPEMAQELPNTDPRVSKAELRARLIKPGKPYPHQN